MILDAGNTRLKFWEMEENTLVRMVLFDNFEQKAVHDFIASQGWHSVLISNTGWKDEIIGSWFPNSAVYFLNHQQSFGIQWAYPSADQLGKDRMAGLIGASFLYPKKNICVVDLGSCMTLDCLSYEKIHLGGIIAPGMKMRFRAMHEFTSKLPLSSENELLEYFGNSTQSCLAAGSVWGLVAEIESHFFRFKSDGFEDPILILTGGDADFLARKIKVHNFVVSDLVFQGMFAVLASLI